MIGMARDLTVDEVLSRGVEQILPSREGLAELLQNNKIRLYLGIDPTGNQLHLGHSVVLRKLQQFADLGHEVILLIGNGTVKIGDPTGKDKTRPMLSDEEIEANFQTWKQQASQILDFDKITIRHNGDWIDTMSFPQMVKLLSRFTVQQLMERDMFQDRLKQKQPIHVHEIMYPVLQGYDSVVLDVDLEIGGSDQLFNMMVGRQLQREMNNREKYVLGVPLLVGSDGRKMGKSLGNFISLTETPENMFGKVMSVVDGIIVEYFTLLTDVPMDEIHAIQEQIAKGENPLQFKKRLAWVITSQYHGEQAAEMARKHFEKTVQSRELPEVMVELSIGAGASLLDVAMQTKVPASRSEARRLIEQGGVELNGSKITDPYFTTHAKDGDVLRVGKRNYFRLS